MQLVYAERLSLEWGPSIMALALRASSAVTPELAHLDVMDIRAYTTVKLVPGGSITESEFVDGVIIPKTVCNRGMRTLIDQVCTFYFYFFIFIFIFIFILFYFI